MKQFYYNTLVSKEDFADREEDIRAISSQIHLGKKITIYAPRRYGKSSLASIILPQEWKTKNSAHLYVDFMGCTQIESVTNRLVEAYAKCLQTYYKKDFLLKGALVFLKNLRLGFSSDAASGEISVELTSSKGRTPSLSEVLDSIMNFCQHKKVLLSFDEFQDLNEIPEALAIFRSYLQKGKNTPMLFLGSKRKLLTQIFASNHSPFFNFSDEWVLKPIPLKEWRPFFNERLKPLQIELDDKALETLCEVALNVPNSICEIGSFIQQNYSKVKLDEQSLRGIVNTLIEKKSENFRFQLSLLTQSEIQFCKAVGHSTFAKSLSSKEFLAKAQMGASTSQKIAKKLYNLGIIEEEAQGYRLSNPLLSYFILHRAY